MRAAWFKFLTKFLLPISPQPHALPHSPCCCGLFVAHLSLSDRDFFVQWGLKSSEQHLGKPGFAHWQCRRWGWKPCAPFPSPGKCKLARGGRGGGQIVFSFSLLLSPGCLWSVFLLCEVRSLCPGVCYVSWHPGSWLLAHAGSGLAPTSFGLEQFVGDEAVI